MPIGIEEICIVLTKIVYGRRYEKVRVEDGGDGLWHQVDRQEKSNSCGPTCVRMTVEMMTGQKYGEDLFRGLTTLAERSAAPSRVSPLAAKVVRAHNYERRGLKPDMVLKAMKDMKLDARKAGKGDNFLEHWQKSSLKRPAVVGYFWRDHAAAGYMYEGAGGHYVVVAGPMKGQPDRFLVLDPATGVQSIHVKSANFYYPRMNGVKNGRLLGEGKLDRNDVYLTY